MSIARRFQAAAPAALLVAAGVAAATLTRGPYLGRPDDSSVAVVWRTDTASDSRVDYASGGRAWQTVLEPEPVTQHVVRIGGLASGGLYRYQVYSDGSPLGPEATFRAPRGPAESVFRFAVIGDTAGVGIPQQIAGDLVDSGADFAIHTGDVVYPSGAESGYDTEFFEPFAAWLRIAPVLPTLGNHDVQTARGAALLSDFILPSNGITAEPRFYCFRQANALFICLDVETSPYGAGSAQYQWLKGLLSGSDALWKFVYFHEPLYSSANPNVVARMILAPLFEYYGVDIVFSGHEHLYERTYPIHDFFPSTPGVIYVTEGGGGAVLGGFQKEGYSAYAASRYSYVLVDIDGGNLLLTAHDPDGSLFDSVALAKQAPSEASPPRALPLQRSKPVLAPGRR
jgi:Calcineurin-like phosphoesterase